IVALLVAAPAIFVVERLVEQAAASASLVQAKLRSGAIQQLLDDQPNIAPIGRWIEQQIDLPAMMANLASWLSNAGAAFARNSAAQVIELVLTFYLLFYFLRDQATARRFLTERLPLTNADTGRLFKRVVDTIHATVYGTIAVAAIQGILGGLIFSFLGLPTPLLWGLVMGLLSIVPVLGAFIVWIPAAIFLAINGDLGKAAILAVWGAAVVGSIDNILRPIFVGDRLRLHTVPAFISMIGGLVLFGMAGLILGPLAVTITILLIEIWAERDRTGYPENSE
ncbi:MAG TPA: AI-2E family transporter, partial [Aurantimonas sp.]